MAKHTTLASLFTDIAAAIRAKTGKTDKLVADDFPTAIAGISTGLDTSDATVTAADVANGVIAYGKDGKVTGTVTTVKSGSTRGYTADTIETGGVATSYVFGSKTLPADVLLRSGAIVQIRQRCSSFGDATAADVRSGKTFTSAAGFMVTGTNGDSSDAPAIQFDWAGAVTRASAKQVEITITRETKPMILAWELESGSSYSPADGVVMYAMGMRTTSSTETARYRVVTKVANSTASTGYVTTNSQMAATGNLVSAGSAAGTWNITLNIGATVDTDTSKYMVNILTGPA